jgi:GT2 family glycosyltransferase
MDNPQLSIVIASINGRPYLEACLEALARQRGDIAAEVIVADCVGRSVTDFVRAEHPQVRLIELAGPQSVPALRSAGILVARGEIVAITEDHCIPAEDWYKSMVCAHREHPGPAIGGAVDNAATERPIDWAVYFCEYSNFSSPVRHGVVRDLPGPNVSYKRTAIPELEDLVREGYWETFLHWRLEAQGHALWSDPRVRVIHRKSFRFGTFFRERYHYGRAFAGTRNESVSVARRLYYIAFSPFLPPLLLARIARRVLSRDRCVGRFVRALPYLAVFTIAWSAGEWIGYATGPGESALQLA